MLKYIIFFIFLLFQPFFHELFENPIALASSSPLVFSTFRLGNSHNCVLIIGGIQGDEPGGFSAATLLATHYEVGNGEIWVVPNLNFPSIIRRSRGLHGDMNRKFAKLDQSDPEFHTVKRIQELILDPHVSLVLNLHDGSGYYRPAYEDKLRNPRRWGQSIIIDQENLGQDAFMCRLGQIAEKVINAVNSRLLNLSHKLHVHNTRTADGDVEMEKSLSYFAVRNGKAAFGLEASKEFGVEIRTFYHLSMVEEFLKEAGITFKRNFDLTPEQIRQALQKDIAVSFADDRIHLPLEDVRPHINFLPLPRNSAGGAIVSKPLMAVLPCLKDKNRLCVHYGNRLLTWIRPDWRELDDGPDAIPATVDGIEMDLRPGQILNVRQKVRFHPLAGYRFNAIGFPSSKKDESGIDLDLKKFLPYYSLDKKGQIFRVEIYKKNRFAGMILIRFGEVSGNMASGKSFVQDRSAKKPDL